LKSSIHRLKGTVFLQLRLLTAGGGVFSANALTDIEASSSDATKKGRKPTRMGGLRVVEVRRHSASSAEWVKTLWPE
jgi:hypothetical protein